MIRHLESYGRDPVRSAVPTWFVAGEAARDMKVVLTGEGADVRFAGHACHEDYTDYADGEALQRGLHRSPTAMHSINLQRVDRMTMAHSLEARVPFLDREMIEVAMTIAPALKQRPEQGGDGEKWILHKASEDVLPSDIVWRGKLQFEEGSGFSDYRAGPARRAFDADAIESAGPDVSAEEALYRQLLRDSDVHMPQWGSRVIGVVAAPWITLPEDRRDRCCLRRRSPPRTGPHMVVRLPRFRRPAGAFCRRRSYSSLTCR